MTERRETEDSEQKTFEKPTHTNTPGHEALAAPTIVCDQHCAVQYEQTHQRTAIRAPIRRPPTCTGLKPARGNSSGIPHMHLHPGLVEASTGTKRINQSVVTQSHPPKNLQACYHASFKPSATFPNPPCTTALNPPSRFHTLSNPLCTKARYARYPL